MSTFANGYQAGVVHTIDALRDFLVSKGVDVPYGFVDAGLSLIDGEPK